MSSLIDIMKCIVDQRKGLQERLEIMVSEQSPIILTPMSISVSNALVTAITSGNWRDTYDPFGPSILNPHNTGASAAEGSVTMAQTSVPFTSWGSFSSFGRGMVGQTIARASGSGEQQSAQDNVSFGQGACTNLTVLEAHSWVATQRLHYPPFCI